MRVLTFRRVLFAIAAYLLIGLVLTITTGGFFCFPITCKNRELRAPHQEFLHAKTVTSTIATIAKEDARSSFSDDTVITFGGSVVLDENGRPKDIWIVPFSSVNDAVCFHIESEKTATVEYFRQKPAAFPALGPTTQLIFLDECWPKIRLKEELKSLDESGRYDFYICPAEPLEHNTTITIYGFGKYSNYSAKVSNPESLSSIHRDRCEILTNRLNYLWAVPLDMAISPIGVPAWYIFWKFFVRF